MNWEQVKGKWKQMKGSVKKRWGKLTDDDLEFVAGKRDELVGRIQERYGISKEEAQDQIDNWNPVALEEPETRPKQERKAS